MYASQISEHGNITHAILMRAISFVGLLSLAKFDFDAKLTFSCLIWHVFPGNFIKSFENVCRFSFSQIYLFYKLFCLIFVSCFVC